MRIALMLFYCKKCGRESEMIRMWWERIVMTSFLSFEKRVAIHYGFWQAMLIRGVSKSSVSVIRNKDECMPGDCLHPKYIYF